MGKSSANGGCSIAMFDYQRLTLYLLDFSNTVSTPFNVLNWNKMCAIHIHYPVFLPIKLSVVVRAKLTDSGKQPCAVL